jgi:hypothetical protein
MSNKKAKQARKAQLKARVGTVRGHLSPHWKFKPWSEYNEQESRELKGAGITNEADYLRILRDGVRSEETDDFLWWAANYGIGFCRNEVELAQAIAWRFASIERDPLRKSMSQGAPSGDLSRMKVLYAWNLERGDRYVASPYSFYTPEGRAWLARYLKAIGFTTLVIDPEDRTEGEFDLRDGIVVHLAEAA